MKTLVLALGLWLGAGDEIDPCDPWVATSSFSNWAVAISDGQIALSSPFESQQTSGSPGRVVIAEWANGTIGRTVQIIEPRDAPDVTRYGRSILMQDGWLFVGGFDGGEGSGVVYGYRKNKTGQWDEQYIIHSPTGATNDHFGSTVALWGDRLAIGAPEAEVDDQIQAGAVYQYQLFENEAKLVQLLSAPTPLGGTAYGQAISMTDERLVVAAPLEPPMRTGAVYVYSRDEPYWVLDQRLTAADAEENHSLGGAQTGSPEYAVSETIAMTESTLYIAAPRARLKDILGVGTVHRFDLIDGTWIETDVMRSVNPPIASLSFGLSIDLDDGVLSVGVAGLDANGVQNGGIELIDVAGPAPVHLQTYVGTELAPDQEYQYLGWKHVLRDGVVVTPYSQWANPIVTLAEIVPPSECDCNANGQYDQSDVLLTTSFDVNGNGIPDECDCPADLDGNAAVDFGDLVTILSAWGSTAGDPSDLDGNGVVDLADLLVVLATWGVCP